MKKGPGVSAAATLTRRVFLGGGAALATTAAVSVFAGAAGAAATDATRRPTPRKSGRSTQADYDVIVVGGGFSGVTAARDCQKNGLRTLVLEAKSRLGGRTFDTQFRGQHVELGGTWVHWTQPAVWSEIMRYGIEVEETPGSIPDRVVLVAGSERTAFATKDRITELVTGIGSYFAESSAVWERPYDSKHTWSAIAARDSMTAADRLRAIEVTPLQRGFLVPLLEAMGHCKLEHISYVEMLRWYSLCINNWGTAIDALSRYKMPAGTGALIRRIAADGKAEVRLGSPVRRVEQRGDVVIVSPQGGSPVTARAVILALPPRVLKNIEFQPNLSDVKLAASREGFTPSGMKFYAEVKGRLGKVEWASAATPANGLVWTYAERENSTILVGFSPGAAEFDGNDEASTQAMLRRFEPDLEVLGCKSYGWAGDPFAQGTYSGFVPGGLVRYFDELARSEGRIYMAGGDIGDNGWRNFIDGAITRGARIAREVSESLLS